MQYTIDDITIDVTWKKVKNMNIRIYPPDAQVKVSVPLRTSEAEMLSFIKSKISWIRKSREKVLQRSSGSAADPGAGNASEDKIRAEAEDYARKVWQRCLLKASLDLLLPVWEEETGIYASRCTIRDMKTKWGSCNTSTRSLNFNLRLADYPIECIEYVVLHELLHIKVPNHGPKFRALLDKYMPDWRERSRVLNPNVRDPYGRVK